MLPGCLTRPAGPRRVHSRPVNHGREQSRGIRWNRTSLACSFLTSCGGDRRSGGRVSQPTQVMVPSGSPPFASAVRPAT
jgi:hypothetical protein